MTNRPSAPEPVAGTLLVDPHPVSRRGLAAVLARETGLRVVEQVGRLAEIRSEPGLPRRDVQLILVEPLLAPRATERLVGELTRIAPGAVIVALSAHDEPGFVERVREAGVAEFLSKTMSADALVVSIRQVLTARGVASAKRTEEEPNMTQDHVYKKIEVTGSSTEGIEDAVRQALERTARTVRKIRWFEVVDVRGHVDDAEVAHWQVTVKIGFTLDAA